MGSWIVGTLILLAVVGAVRCIWKDKKSGKSCSSCGGCKGCSGCRTKD